MIGDHDRVRRNAVYDTGGRTGGTVAGAIYAAADIIDHTIDGVFTAGTTNTVTGIEVATGFGGIHIIGNRIDGLANNGGTAYGIVAGRNNQTIAGNTITAADAGTDGIGIIGYSANAALPYPFCRDNTVSDFTTAMYWCQDAGGNASH